MKLPKLELPKTLLEELLPGVSLIIGGRIYKAANPKAQSPYTLSIEGLSFPLVELEQAAKLEQLYESFYGPELKTWMQARAEKIAKTKRNFDDVECEAKLVSFIVDEVFPYFGALDGDTALEEVLCVQGPEPKTPRTAARPGTRRSAKYNQERPLEDQQGELAADPLTRPDGYYRHPAGTEDDDPLDAVLGRIAAAQKSRESAPYRRTRETESKQKADDAVPTVSVLERDVLHNDNILVFYQQVCKLWNKERYLIEGRNLETSLEVNIGTVYCPTPAIMSIGQLLEQYNKALKAHYEQLALKLSPRIDEAHKTLYRCTEIMKSKEFDASGLGIERIGPRECYVTLSYPEFANQGDDNAYYKFPAGSVGVRLTLSPSGKVVCDSPVTMDARASPFLYYWDTTRDTRTASICMGGYTSRKTDAAKVADLLTTASTVMTSGYFGGVADTVHRRHIPHHVLNRNNFSEYECTKAEAEEIGITNIR